MSAKGTLHLVCSAAAFLLALSACGTPQTGTQTNWLHGCDADAQCGAGLSCECGVCTVPCEAAAWTCSEYRGAACLPPADPGVVALCGGRAAPTGGLCLPPCESGACPSGTSCVAGVCAPHRQATEVVMVDPSRRHQTLIGFGAGIIGFMSDQIAGFADDTALYDAMFADSGFEVVRLTNRYQGAPVDLASSVEILAAAELRLGRAPTVVMTSASPPDVLKASGDTWCRGDVETCTLARAGGGGFDYPGFAGYWRASLDTYAAQGIEPDYISIQNNPDWVPPESGPLEGCRFLPREGRTTVSVSGSDTQVEYPGYVEALAAVKGALSGLATVPSMVAPEATSVLAAVAFARELDLSAIDALAHHMYGSDPEPAYHAALDELGQLGRTNKLPVFQTETSAEALRTAVLMQEALGTIGATVYLQNDFVAPPNLERPDPTALISLHEGGFTLEDTYHTMRHFARDTGPGWVRIDSPVAHGSVLATAWLAPTSRSITIVLVNPEPTDATVELVLAEPQTMSSRVTRTVFPGSERSAELGPMPENGVVTVPGESVVTVVLRR